MTIHVIHGQDPDDDLYVDENKRRCPECDEIKLIEKFEYSPSTWRVSVTCRECNRKVLEIKRATEEASADRQLAKALTTVTGRRVLIEQGKTAADALKSVMKGNGGHRRLYAKVAKVLSRGLDDVDIEVALKTVTTINNMQKESDRATMEPVDISSLTDEDKMLILHEPAKNLLMTSPAFLKSLLSDPEIRSLVLAEIGVTVLEADSGAE